MSPRRSIPMVAAMAAAVLLAPPVRASDRVLRAEVARTVVVLDLAPEGEAKTPLRFTHLGWGEGPEWDEAYAYFDRAWGGFVLPSLVRRFERGPIDWAARSKLEPLAGTMRRVLSEDERP